MPKAWFHIENFLFIPIESYQQFVIINSLYILDFHRCYLAHINHLHQWGNLEICTIIVQGYPVCFKFVFVYFYPCLHKFSLFVGKISFNDISIKTKHGLIVLILRVNMRYVVFPAFLYIHPYDNTIEH